jgi:hypothetical protein
MDTWGQSDNDDRLATGIQKVPGRVVDGDMDMTQSRRYGHCALAENRQNPKIFGPVLDEHFSARQRFGERLIYDEYRWWFAGQGDQWRRTFGHCRQRRE